MVADEVSQIGEKAMSTGFAIAGIMKWILIGIFAVGAIAGIWYLFARKKKRYIYKTEAWGSVGGVPDVLVSDKARPIKVRTKEGINSLMFFKKMKRYLKMPNRLFFIGKKIRFWFRQDGELTPIMLVKVKFFDFKFDKEAGEKIYVGETAEQMMKQARDNEEIFCPAVMEDVNEKFAVLKVKFINEDARLSHVSTGKIVRDMFSINKFFKEHGATIMMIIGVIVLVFAFILMANGMKDIQDNSASVAEATSKLADRLEKVNEGTIQILERLNAIGPKNVPTT
jgi:uncharacterized membrane protein